MDADGAIWTGVGAFGDNLVGRVREGGEVLERVQLDRACFACMLGGEDRRTLFMLAADWRMEEGFEDNIARLTQGPRTGQVLTAPAPAAAPAGPDPPAAHCQPAPRGSPGPDGSGTTVRSARWILMSEGRASRPNRPCW